MDYTELALMSDEELGKLFAQIEDERIRRQRDDIMWSNWEQARQGPPNPDGVIEVDGERLFQVHLPSECEGRGCVIHHPSDHHMVSFRRHWRQDRGIFERICPHGVGHDDPDDLAYRRSVGREASGIHGCCSGQCCVAPTVGQRQQEAEIMRDKEQGE